MAKAGREEHILTFNLHCKIPFGSIQVRIPNIVALATPARNGCFLIPRLFNRWPLGI